MSQRPVLPPKSSSAYLVGYGAIAWTLGLLAWLAPDAQVPADHGTQATAEEPRSTWPPPPAPERERTQWAETEASCSMTVGVAEGEASAALAGARLTLHHVVGRRAAGHGERTLTANLDVTEDARIEGLVPGLYHLTAIGADGRLSSGPALRCVDNTTRHFADLTSATHTFRVAGEVTGANRDGLGNGEIVLEQLEGEPVLLGPAHLPLDAEGRFEARLPPGRYQMLAVAPEHVGRRLSVDVTADLEVKLALDWRPEVKGIVVDESGRPLAGARVFLGPRFDPNVSAVVVGTDDFGAFTLPVRPQFAPVVTAVVGDRVGTVSLPAVTRLGGPEGVEVMVRAGRPVHGFVLTAAGRPHAFGTVSYRVKELGIDGEVRADAEGRFLIAGMPRDEDVEVWPKGGASGLWAGAVSTPEQSGVMLTYVPPAY